jgi:hypothetical protein
MNLTARFIGKIQDKNIGYEGVAETIEKPDFPARIMLVKGVSPWLKTDDVVNISWPEGRILGRVKNHYDRIRNIFKSFKIGK